MGGTRKSPKGRIMEKNIGVQYQALHMGGCEAVSDTVCVVQARELSLQKGLYGQ